MAWTIEQDETAFVIRQRRTWFRRIAYVWAAFGVAGVIFALRLPPESYQESLACDHATHGCRYQVTKPIGFADSELSNAHLAETGSPHQWLLTWGPVRRGGRYQSNGYEYEMCQTHDPAAVAELRERGDLIQAFAADPKHAPIAIACTATMLGMTWGAVAAVVGGLVFFALMFRRFSATIDARFDRATRRVAVTYRCWFGRALTIDEPFSSIRKIVVVPRSTSGPYLAMLLTEGRAVILWSPVSRAKLGAKVIEVRAKALTDWLHHGQPVETSSASSAIQP